MLLYPFHVKFPKIAEEECRKIIIDENNKYLQKWEYPILEFYCTDPKCDCRKVTLNILDPKGKIASFNYWWENLRFYTKWLYWDKELAKELVGLNIDVHVNKSKYANVFFEIMKKKIFQDNTYSNILENHYYMMKQKKMIKKFDFSYKKKKGF